MPYLTLTSEYTNKKKKTIMLNVLSMAYYTMKMMIITVMTDR